MPRVSRLGSRSQEVRPHADVQDARLPVRAIAALTRLGVQAHVAVIGRGGLETALELWRAGFVHVDVAADRLSRPAGGAADAVIVQGDGERLARSIEAACGVLRVGGWLIVRITRSAKDSLESVRRRLATAGFTSGPGFIDADGAWIAARRRPALRLHVNAGAISPARARSAD